MTGRFLPGSTSRILPASFGVLLVLTAVVAALGYLHSEPVLVAGAALLVIGGASRSRSFRRAG